MYSEGVLTNFKECTYRRFYFSGLLIKKLNWISGTELTKSCDFFMNSQMEPYFVLNSCDLKTSKCVFFSQFFWLAWAFKDTFMQPQIFRKCYFLHLFHITEQAFFWKSTLRLSCRYAIFPRLRLPKGEAEILMPIWCFWIGHKSGYL